jgi:uncharacterized membrane protein
MMGSFEQIGRWMVIAGVVLVFVGGLVWLFGKFKFFDRLPGTIRVEMGGLTCVVPLLASILLSILLTVVLNIVLRNINR